MDYIKFENVTKEYVKNNGIESVLKNFNIEIKKGEKVIIVGPSGSGKTSILNMIGGIDKPTYGDVIVNGIKINKLNERKLMKYRQNEIGFAFQDSNFMENLSVLENVELISQLCKFSKDPKEILKKVGLSKKENDFIHELSSEEKQKLSIATALVKKANILLLDEPFDLLDLKTTKQILKLLKSISDKNKVTIIITSRNDNIDFEFSKKLDIKNGTVIEKSVKKNKKKFTGDVK